MDAKTYADRLRRFLELCAEHDTEICVGCHAVTDIPKDCHIHDPRRSGNYVEGVGQFCNKCGTKHD